MAAAPPESDEDRGLYRIRAVSEMTGVAAPTLRAWERRYGVPAPERTSSAYRLYSARDVALVRQVKALCDAGVSAAEAADRALRQTNEREPAPLAADADAFAAAASRIVEATRSFAPHEVEAAVQRAAMLGGAREVFERAFAPAMRAIGDLWHAGRLSIAQEHLASTLVETATRDLLRVSRPGAPTARALFACFAGEDHALGLLGVALAAQALGVRVIDLGARTPPAALADAVAALSPDFVCLSSTVPPEGAEARALVRAYADACGSTPWMVGGAGARSLRALVEKRGGSVPLAGEASIEQALADALRAARKRPRPPPSPRR